MPFYYEFWREYNAIYERSVEDFTSFNGNKRSNLCGEKKYNEGFRGVYF